MHSEVPAWWKKGMPLVKTAEMLAAEIQENVEIQNTQVSFPMEPLESVIGATPQQGDATPLLGGSGFPADFKTGGVSVVTGFISQLTGVMSQ